MPGSFDQSPLEKLLSSHPKKWGAIHRARSLSLDKVKLLEDKFIQTRLVRPDACLICFGSLARLEITPGSDLDWALLVDGNVDGEDFGTSREIVQRMAELEEKPPGPSGIFGKLTFSHQLVHDIGGNEDTNVNTTRRVLMLLESRAIGDSSVRDRVLRAIIRRYVEQQTHYKEEKLSVRPRLPRFLMNDIIRYWRIVAVDYANKVRQGGEKRWALRNIKLRMSRKLLYSAGLLLCMEPHFDKEALKDSQDWMFPNEPGPSDITPYVELLFRCAALTPLDHLARACERFSVTPETTELLLGSYNDYLVRVSDPALRDSLEDLSYENSKHHPEFNELRKISHNFQAGLNRLFFRENKELTDIMQTYAVF